MQKIYLVIGSLLAGLAVALGAFGAHGLKKIVSSETVAVYQTGVQYQMYHALALILVGILSDRIYNGFVSYAGVLFVAGVILFSGSLYLIVSMNAMNKTVPTALGILTPVGGLFFILGWVCLIVGLLKK
ncbi:DUF423 domain-containing protein [Flavisolibacter ginsenosidimutans]|uniref:DUF423 domain-containing protein n=1 Tax=Flavisolibacter ginsenosidimutans TaxID=661481 RepID=A0A5B8UFK8_9BACT|nr:DUF423 domain-containing protein [Flavisolibacter ginsenosidimutans]QEC54919.1 DUF423 domain-containing protein [Flavisolibacter ginsenosidimutans]